MRTLIVLLGLLCCASAQAAAGAIPASLEAWRGWVMKDREYRECPLLAGASATNPGDFACLWPGTLEISADAQGATLHQRWHVEVDGWVPLPGSDAHWPQQVTLDGKPVAVVDRGGPRLWMSAGDHELRARMVWSERPQALEVPAAIALVALEVDGKRVAPLQRTGDQLTLGRGKTTTVEADSLDLRVFRKFTDGIPGELTTQIRLYVSGQAREEVLGPVLPEGFIPLALGSPQWSARLDDEGRLHVQVQPGSSTVSLSARAAKPIDTLVARLPEHWVEQEIWSYESVPSLRVTSISGAIQVDPRQADVPPAWNALPAYAMNDGDTLSIEQRSRGLDDQVANRLSLRREAWLDFSGDGWFARDRISGQMLNGWRFDVAAPFRLQRAQASSSNDDALLITRGASPDLSGVEWRKPDVDLNAGVRIDAAGASMPVTGWRAVFDQVTTTLHLPYGYRLIAAPGTDVASGSWLSRWTLLDVFLVAIIVLVAGRLLGWSGAVLAAVYLLLAYQEGGSPLWTLLAVVVLALIARALPAGRLASVARGLRVAALVLLALIALPFAANQLREALYPQLESGTAAVASAIVEFQEPSDDYAGNAVGEAARSAPMPAAAPPPPPVQSEERGMLDSPQGVISYASRAPPAKRAKLNNRYSQSTVVQTGAGEPGWQLGNRYQLNWSGPVLADQQVRLLIAPPWLVRPLRVILVGVLGLLLWRLLGDARIRLPGLRSRAGVAVLVLGLAGLSVPQARAQEFPPDSLLQQLQARLLEAPPCAPSCARLANAEVDASGDRLRIALEVHALDRSAVPIPGDEASLRLESIRIDGVARDAVAGIAGKSWIAVERGVHRVEIDFATLGDRVALAFPMMPARIRVVAGGWQASGIADERLLTETLTLARARAGSSEPTAAAEQRFPPYVRVYRTINLDLEWSVENVVERLAPREGGFTTSVPILAGEHVSTPGFKLRDGKLTLAMADRESQTGWSSTLEQSSTLALSAPELGSHAEVWRILAGPTWHVEFSGVPETATTSADGDGFHEFEFHPLPGETLTVHVTKPAAVEGATRAIDRLNLASEFGLRARSYTLQFDLRASQGGDQVIALPAEAELLGVSRDGASIGARILDGKLSLPVNPGLQKFQVRLRENAPMSTHVATPPIALGLPAANIALEISLPNDRWLLAAFGPAVGPAVLFWGELVVAIVLAWLLSRWRKGRLRFHHWLLLVLGFSTFSWLALVVVVAWLFALDWRGRNAPETNWHFNLVQLGLAVLSLVALVCLFESIRNGLLGSPDMVVRGNGSWANHLQWFADRSSDALPTASVISLPLWVYNLIMLVWALWLAWAVVGWLRRGFAAWMNGGYWRPWRRPAEPADIDLPSRPPPPVA
ncbi:MAG: hypothetical protein KF811_10475 [Dokdonella sp.]|nr:hypothetical protein [Dokdonella sp.]MCB1573048.1 hypothetical protein [Xanthomonadales bacterium]